MEEDESTPATIEPRHAEFPPLRVHHFLLWMTATAICLVVEQDEFQSIDNLPAHFGDGFRMAAIALGATILISLQITIAFIGIISWYQNGGFPKHPGHWIALFASTSIVLISLLSTVFRQHLLNFQFTIAGITFVVWAAVFFFVARRSSDTSSWRAAYYLIGTMAFCVGLTMMPLFSVADHSIVEKTLAFGVVVTFVLFVLVAIFAMMTDQLFNIRRDWGHWVAVLSPFGFGAILVLSAIISQLIAKL